MIFNNKMLFPDVQNDIVKLTDKQLKPCPKKNDNRNSVYCYIRQR